MIIIKGDLFYKPFDIVHAGEAMDQPTIGKYLILFTFFSIIALPWSIFVRLMSNRQSIWNCFAFAVPMLVVLFWGLSILSWPGCLLVQYIASMGMTLKRLSGIVVVVFGAIIWITTTSILLWRYIPKKNENQSKISGQPYRSHKRSDKLIRTNKVINRKGGRIDINGTYKINIKQSARKQVNGLMTKKIPSTQKSSQLRFYR